MHVIAQAPVTEKSCKRRRTCKSSQELGTSAVDGGDRDGRCPQHEGFSRSALHEGSHAESSQELGGIQTSDRLACASQGFRGGSQTSDRSDCE